MSTPTAAPSSIRMLPTGVLVRSSTPWLRAVAANCSIRRSGRNARSGRRYAFTMRSGSTSGSSSWAAKGDSSSNGMPAVRQPVSHVSVGVSSRDAKKIMCSRVSQPSAWSSSAAGQKPSVCFIAR